MCMDQVWRRWENYEHLLGACWRTAIPPGIFCPQNPVSVRTRLANSFASLLVSTNLGWFFISSQTCTYSSYQWMPIHASFRRELMPFSFESVSNLYLLMSCPTGNGIAAFLYFLQHPSLGHLQSRKGNMGHGCRFSLASYSSSEAFFFFHSISAVFSFFFYSASPLYYRWHLSQGDTDW